MWQTPSTGLRLPSFKEEGAGKRSSECGCVVEVSDADSVCLLDVWQTPSTGLRHPSFKEEGAGKRSSECGFVVEVSDADSVCLLFSVTTAEGINNADVMIRVSCSSFFFFSSSFFPSFFSFLF